jgi:N-acyl-D-amino-acid deacylase
MKLDVAAAFVASVVALLLSAPAPAQAQEHFDVLLRGGQVIDGTGNPWFYADVGVRDGRIVAVGPLEGATADRVVDATGKVVTPGFIDLHSHAGDGGRSLGSDDPLDRGAPNLVAQGATTLVVNQDGRSPWPLRDQRSSFESRGIGPNAALLVGHGAVRGRVMGDDHRRAATPDEVRSMRALVRQAMEEGAFGMSAAHEYVPMIWSTTDEIVALVQEIAPYQGIYIVHERSSGAEPMWWWPSQDAPGEPTMLDAVVETIEVADRTRVTSIQTHVKARGSNYWGSSQAIIQLIERARARGIPIWADSYPYNTTGSDGSTVLLPPWLEDEADRAAGQGADPDYGAVLERYLADSSAAERIRMDIRHEMSRRGGAENLLIIEHPTSGYVGSTLLDLARERGIDPVEMAIRLQLEGDRHTPGGARMRGFSLSEDDVANFAAQPWVATASDAGIAMAGDGPTHPRYYGTFPRKIRRFALDTDAIPVSFAIRSMTSLPAQILGLRDRGQVREGHWADLVVLDLALIRDKATPLDPHRYPSGIEHVLVNGVFVVDGGELTRALPGRVITPADKGGRPISD